eukprot:SAG11_NODE_20584_length_442_cov_1.087464_1_plen_51_part_00
MLRSTMLYAALKAELSEAEVDEVQGFDVIFVDIGGGSVVRTPLFRSCGCE